MTQMRAVLLSLLACLACSGAAAQGSDPDIFETVEVTACDRLRAQASWDGCHAERDRETCTYNPPPGWVLIDHRVRKHSSNNGSRSVSTLAKGLDLVTEEDVRFAYEMAMSAAANKGSSEYAASLEQKRDQHIRTLLKYKTNKNTIQARVTARAHGNCLDKKRGWEEISVYANIMYVGEPNVADLMRTLVEAAPNGGDQD